MPSLRATLLADAAASGAMGVLLAAGAAPLAPVLQLPSSLLRGAGLALVPFAALLAWLAGRARRAGAGAVRRTLWLVVAGNALWAVDSVLLLLTGWVSPSALGLAFVLAQAAAVGVLTALELAGLRSAAPRAAA